MFQAKIDQTFEGCEGEEGITDDIAVYGLTKEEYDRHMHDNAKQMQNHWSWSWIQTNARLTRRLSVVKMVFNLATIKFSPKEDGTAYQCTGAWLRNGYLHGCIHFRAQLLDSSLVRVA